MPHLTDAIIKRLPTPATGNKIAYDDTLPGFGIRVSAGGSRSFILNYRLRNSGRERRFTIGGSPNWRTTDARTEARRLKQLIDQGGDPLGEIESERAAPTMVDLIDRFIAEHVSRKRPGTQIDYRSIIDRHLRPHFGAHIKVADVRPEDVDRLHRKITNAGHIHRANRTVAVLSKMFSLAIRWAMRSDNPCRGVEKNREHARRRYLDADELSRLVAALAVHPDRQSANAIRLLLLTGARRGEVLGMRWGDIDLTGGTWNWEAAGLKQGRDHSVPLSGPARAVLSEIHSEQISGKRQLPEHVFPSHGSTGHLREIKKSWRSLCRAAGVEALRLHDLRHSFASELVSSGASLPLIGSLLGHSSPATTARYSHLYSDPQRAAVERVGAAVVAAAGNLDHPNSPSPTEPEKRVLPFPGRRGG